MSWDLIAWAIKQTWEDFKIKGEKMDTKKWYQSKTIWTSIVMISISLLSLLADIKVVPADIALKVSGFIGTIAGAFGIYLRTQSDGTPITK